MKKILFATTALVATAGVASAQVALTGSADMGVMGGDQIDTQFISDLDVRFTLTGEADNGLTFGATIDLDEATDSELSPDFENPAVQGGEAVFISFGGMTFTIGDTDGAFDASVPEMNVAGGSINDNETTHAGFQHGDGVGFGYGDFVAADAAAAVAAALVDPTLYATAAAYADAMDAAASAAYLDSLGFSFPAGASADEIEADIAIAVASTGLDGFGDGQIARFDYAYDAFTFSLSAEQVAQGADAVNVGDTVWGLGATWSGQLSAVDLTVGFGYQTLSDFASITGIGATGGFSNGITAGLSYSVTSYDDDFANLDDVQHVGLGIGYEMNALAVGLNWGQFKYDDETQSGYGLAASYDLGGGLSAQFGWGHSEDVFGDDADTYSLGLAMSF